MFNFVCPVKFENYLTGVRVQERQKFQPQEYIEYSED